MVQSLDAKPWIQRADYKLYKDFELHKGWASLNLPPCCSSVNCVYSFLLTTIQSSLILRGQHLDICIFFHINGHFFVIVITRNFVIMPHTEVLFGLTQIYQAFPLKFMLYILHLGSHFQSCNKKHIFLYFFWDILNVVIVTVWTFYGLNRNLVYFFPCTSCWIGNLFPLFCKTTSVISTVHIYIWISF